MKRKISFPSEVVKIAIILAEKGYNAYAVGGCVRDSLMGREPSDWDMTTDARPETMLEIFQSAGLHTIPTGLKHGTVTVMIDKKPYEVTTFRIDGEYTDSRRPDSVTFSSDISEDLRRRDFTVNAMAADPLSIDGEGRADIVDLYGGICDIENKTIKCVGEPRERFTEDALRILRCVRFATVLGFDIENDTFEAAKALAPRLKMVSAERKRVELEKTLLSDSADRGVELLLSAKLPQYIHPEIRKNTVALSTLPKIFAVRLAALLIDDRKPQLSAMKLSNEVKDNASLLADNTFYLECNRYFGNDTPANARYMIAKYASLAPYAAQLRDDIDFSLLIQEEAQKSPAVTVSALEINGNELLSLGIEAIKLGRIMARLLIEVIRDPSLNTKESLSSLALALANEI